MRQLLAQKELEHAKLAAVQQDVGVTKQSNINFKPKKTDRGECPADAPKTLEELLKSVQSELQVSSSASNSEDSSTSEDEDDDKKARKKETLG